MRESEKPSTCLYCGTSDPKSIEHTLPACFGEFRNLPLLTNRICKDCNGKLSKAEQQLCRSGPEAILREYLGVSGRGSHTRVNPFERGSSGAKAIDFKAIHPEFGFEVLFEFHPKYGFGELLQAVFVDETGKSHPVRLRAIMTPKESADYLRQYAKRHGYEKMTVHFFGNRDDTAWLEKLGAELGEDRVEWSQPQTPMVVANPLSAVSVTGLFFQAVAKVAFHYFLAVTNLVSGDEPIFNDLREYLLEGGRRDEFVAEVREPIFYFPKPGLTLEWGHLLSVESLPDRVQARLQLFIGPQNNPWTYRVTLTRQPLPFTPIGHYCHYFQQPISEQPFVRILREGRFQGEAVELASFGSSFESS